MQVNALQKIESLLQWKLYIIQWEVLVFFHSNLNNFLEDQKIDSSGVEND